MVRLSPENPGQRVFMTFSVYVLFYCLILYLSCPLALQNIFHTPVARYSLFVLKMLLNTQSANQPAYVFSTQVTQCACLTTIYHRHQFASIVCPEFCDVASKNVLLFGHEVYVLDVTYFIRLWHPTAGLKTYIQVPFTHYNKYKTVDLTAGKFSNGGRDKTVLKT